MLSYLIILRFESKNKCHKADTKAYDSWCIGQTINCNCKKQQAFLSNTCAKYDIADF